MSSADNKNLVRVQTSELKDKLNNLYSRMRVAANSNSPTRANLGHFDSLWDLKELALLEHRQSVDVPETWLRETDQLEKQRVRHGS